MTEHLLPFALDRPNLVMRGLYPNRDDARRGFAGLCTTLEEAAHTRLGPLVVDAEEGGTTIATVKHELSGAYYLHLICR